jgi:hypothetical protein
MTDSGLDWLRENDPRERRKRPNRLRQKPEARRPVGIKPVNIPPSKPTFQPFWHLKDGRCMHWNHFLADPELEAQIVHKKQFAEQRRLLKAGKLPLGRI